MPRAYTRNHACLDCGAPTGRANTRCKPCGDAHRNRQAAADPRRQEYRRTYKAARSPKTVPQERPDLPPIGELPKDEQGIQCHICGRWMQSLPYHIVKTHGMSTDDYRAQFGLARDAALVSPVVSAKLSANAITQELYRVSVPFGPDNPPAIRPKGSDNRRQARINMSRDRKSVV